MANDGFLAMLLFYCFVGDRLANTHTACRRVQEKTEQLSNAAAGATTLQKCDSFPSLPPIAWFDLTLTLLIHDPWYHIWWNELREKIKNNNNALFVHSQYWDARGVGEKVEQNQCQMSVEFVFNWCNFMSVHYYGTWKMANKNLSFLSCCKA